MLRRSGWAVWLLLLLLASACSSSGQTHPGQRADGSVQLASRSVGVDRHRNLRDFWIQDVSFVDRWHGWALGYFDLPHPGLLTMQRTEDGGRTWYLVAPPTTLPGRSVTHVRFANRMDGWAFGPALYATHDGGSTWTRERVGGPVLALEPAGETVWAIAHHRLMTSSIPADRWHRVRTAPPVRGEVQGLVRFGADAGWLVWLDHVVPTRDGGRSWSQLPSPCNPADELEDMAAASSDVLWLYCGVFGAGSELASVYRSADGGRTWEVSVRPSNFGEGDAVDAASPEVLWVANGEGLV